MEQGRSGHHPGEPDGPRPAFTRGRVLKTDVTILDAFRLDIPASGSHLRVFHALNRAYLADGSVYGGVVDEWVGMATRAGMTEDEARGSFDILQRYGMLRIDEGGAFTPTQQYLEYFDGQLAPEETTT